MYLFLKPLNAVILHLLSHTTKDSESLGSESFSIHVPTMVCIFNRTCMYSYYKAFVYPQAERKAMKAENVYASFDHVSI